MRAAMKGTVVDAYLITCIFDDECPEWFYNEILQYCQEDGFGNMLYIFPDESNYFCLVPEDSVVLRNRRGEIRHMTLAEFDEYYFDLGEYKAALKVDCFDYEYGTNGQYVQLENSREETRVLRTDEFYKLFKPSSDQDFMALCGSRIDYLMKEGYIIESGA